MFLLVDLVNSFCQTILCMKEHIDCISDFNNWETSWSKIVSQKQVRNSSKMESTVVKFCAFTDTPAFQKKKNLNVQVQTVHYPFKMKIWVVELVYIEDQSVIANTCLIEVFSLVTETQACRETLSRSPKSVSGKHGV